MTTNDEAMLRSNPKLTSSQIPPAINDAIPRETLAHKTPPLRTAGSVCTVVIVAKISLIGDRNSRRSKG